MSRVSFSFLVISITRAVLDHEVRSVEAVARDPK